MKAFMDWEFNERGAGIPIQPISVGIVTEHGDEYYGINAESLSNVARHPWLSKFVAPYLPMTFEGAGIVSWDSEHPEYPFVLSLDGLIDGVRNFLAKVPDLELWGYYCAYDHVVLAQLFGTMAELPAHIPMWTHELMQEIERVPGVTLPPQPEVAHHALWDARWTRDAYFALYPEQATWIEGVEVTQLVPEVPAIASTYGLITRSE